MLFRPTVEADLDRLLDVVVDEPVSWAHPERIRAELKLGNYRPEWMWIAEDDGVILARVVFWGMPADAEPYSIDCLSVHPSVADRAGLAAELMSAAIERLGTKPEYHLFLPNAWRERPDVAAAVAWRAEVMAKVGIAHRLERFRYEWTPAAPVPEPSRRLLFRPEPDDEVMADAFRRVAQGTLDHSTLKELATMDPVAQARGDVRMYQDNFRGERDWWRLAFTPDGELVGLALPSANNGGPIVGYIGVVPEHRGKGYVSELLDEITRFHAARGAEVVRADTDFANVPMAKAFERAGYVNTSVRLVLSDES
ncbi:GNAT family N-acetyltransferase [Nonomuraea soli]|uniref:RimJ/RimL family protein N-acetyltransferase n=1 Tax=Nonomuraea soli TaxID=1032476 RepID=A0A7W0CRX3_9ACTN|nr:GNAT family N-acetyltransferase [Nonomuraea soli]MBA2896206.1 RimJ/RimL family protein N-acetyltransferase [Nonomuraea soli]